MWCGNSRAKRVTCTNVALCFDHLPAVDQGSLARQSLIETGKTLAEVGAIWRNDISWLNKRIVAVEGKALLQAKLAENKGLIVIAPHFGNWEVVSPFIANFKPLTALYQPASNPELEAYILKSRSKDNIQMAPTNRRGVALLLKALNKGEIAGILPDQVPDGDTGAEEGLFYGQPTKTMTLVHNLLKRTQCNALMTVAIRTAGGFKIVIQQCDEGLFSSDQIESVTGLNKSVENCIALAPAQYQWEYKRFKGRTIGAPYH